MKKYLFIILTISALLSCSKKNNPGPGHTIVATIEVGVNPLLKITETVGGKTTQIYNGDADQPYKFSAPARASITIIADAQSNGDEAPDLSVTDNGAQVGNIQTSLDSQLDLHAQVTFTLK
jgi:nitrous oxide reductase accessory protein NosL